MNTPPTSEEVLAYMRGELSAEEEEKVRERLVWYPELVRTLTEPFPDEDPAPGTPGYVSDEKMVHGWETLQNRIHPIHVQPVRGGRLVHFLSSSLAVAAAVSIVLGGLLWNARSELDRPRVWEEQVLEPDGQRGIEDGSTVLTAKGDTVVIVVPLIGSTDFATYRLEIVENGTTPRRSLWRSEVLRRGDSQSFSMVVPRKFLDPGRYQVVLYGVDDAREHRVATYSFRVPAR